MAYFILASLLIHLSPLAVAASPAQRDDASTATRPVPGAQKKELVEDPRERTPYRRVLRSIDEKRIEFSLAPRLDEEHPDGALATADALVPDSGPYAYRADKGLFRAWFTNKSDGNQVYFEHNGRSVTIDVPDLGPGKGATKARAAGKRLHYERDGAPVSSEYEVGPLGLIENIWLHRPGGPTEFRYTMHVDGVTPKIAPDGSIWFMYNDSVTERAFYTPPAFAEDAKGTRVSVPMDLQPLEKDRWQVTVSLDRKWLQASERAWPVRIDPDLLIDSGGGKWKQLHPNESESGFGDTLYILKNTYTTHLQFDLRDFVKPENQVVSSAYLELSAPRQWDMCYVCGTQAWIAQENQEWYWMATWQRPWLIGTSWSGGDACTAPNCAPPRLVTFVNPDTVTMGGLTYYRFRFDVTDLVRKWLDGTVANNGFYLYGTDPYGKKIIIVSPVHFETSQHPRLVINYTSVNTPVVSVNPTNPIHPQVTVSSQAPLAKTEIYVDGILAGANTNSAPGTFTFNIDATKFPYASHELRARTYTSAGQVADSPVATATFGEGGITPPVNLAVYPRPSGGMRLTWARSAASNPARTVFYTISRSPDGTPGNYTVIASNISATAYDDLTATGTPYYKVKAVTSAGVASVETLGARASAPVRPFGLRYQHLAGGGIQLRWSPSPTAAADSSVSYRVIRNGATIATGIPGTDYTDTNVAVGSTYTYSVVAANSLGQVSAVSESLTAVAKGAYTGPEAPTQVRASAGRDKRISLTWTPPADAGVTFDVVRYTGSTPWAEPVSAPVATGLQSLFWNDTDPGLAEGTQYWYRVRSIRNGDAGPWSEPVGAVASVVPRTGPDSRQAFVGQPFAGSEAAVNLSSGNLVLTAPDLSAPIPLMPLVLNRTHNSEGCGSCTILGTGWRLSAEWAVNADASGAVVVEGDGTEHRFTWNGSGYIPEARFYGTLARDGGTGGWTLLFPDLTQYRFRADGKLEKIQDRHGNEVRNVYDPDGRLTAIASYPVNRSIQLEYDPAGRLSAARSLRGGDVVRSVQYQYDSAGRLAAVINDAGEATRYSYDEHNRLVQVEDGAGRWNYVVYGVNGAVSHLVDGLGNATAINTTASGTTVVTDPVGNQTTYTFDAWGWLGAVTDALNNTTSFAYDSTFTKYTVTNPRGLVSEYSYDASGRVVQVFERPSSNAETPDLVAPGVSSRISTAAYSGTTGDITDQAVQVTGDIYHGSEYSYTHMNSGAYPNRLTATSIHRYTQTGSGSKTQVGGSIQYTFDTADSRPGWITRIQDPNGNSTDFTYDEFGAVRLVTKRDIDRDLVAAGAVSSSRDVVQEFTYNHVGQVAMVSDWHYAGIPGTAGATYLYDSAGRRTQTINPDGARTYVMYDPAGLPVLAIGANGQSKVLLHDSARRTAAAVSSGIELNPAGSALVGTDGGTTAFAYDAAGRNVAVTNPLGHVTSLTYDPLHRVVRATDPNGMAQAWEYDTVGNVIAMITGSVTKLNSNLGYKVEAAYYLSNLLKQTLEPLPVAAITPPAGVTLPPTRPGDPVNTTYNITRFHYNLLGQKVDQWDGNGYRIGYGYDDLDRLASVTQYMGNGDHLVTQYGYDHNGNRITVRDARDMTTVFRYDGLNRMWRRIDARGVVTQEYRFDEAGNLSQKREPRNLDGQNPFTSITNYTYDAAHRLTHIGYQRSNGSTNHLAPNVTYAYDGSGHRVYMWDGYGPTYYAYDGMGRLRDERGLQQITVTYGYDLASRLVAMTSHIGTIQYAYDNGNRLARITDPFGHQTLYRYDDDYGQLVELTLPLKEPYRLRQSNTYYRLSDGRLTNRLSQQEYRRLRGTEDTRLWYDSITYDLVGMIRTNAPIAVGYMGMTRTFNYDEAYRLVHAERIPLEGYYPRTYYRYDKAGNRTTWGNSIENGQMYVYDGSRWWNYHTFDEANRLTRIDEWNRSGGGTHGYGLFTLEDNGNTLKEEWHYSLGPNECSRAIFTYHDDANRLVERHAERVNRSTYGYDGDGRRLFQRFERFEWDDRIHPQDPCAFRIADVRSTAYDYANGEILNERSVNGVPVWYIRDPKGNLLYALHFSGELDGKYYPSGYVKDYLGTIHLVTDVWGYNANRYTYDAFGAITSSSSTLRNSYTYASYAFDQNVGNYHLKARYYNPSLGRFLTQDTYLGNPWQPWTLNLYSYVGNNPINFIDPSGHWAVTIGLSGVAAILTGGKGEVELAFDDDWNIGIETTVQGGVGVAFGGGPSGALYWNADTIEDLAGPITSVGGNVGSLGVEAELTGEGTEVVGVSVAVGGKGWGAGGYVMGGRTFVRKWFNLKEAVQAVWEKIDQTGRELVKPLVCSKAPELEQCQESESSTEVE